MTGSELNDIYENFNEEEHEYYRINSDQVNDYEMHDYLRPAPTYTQILPPNHSDAKELYVPMRSINVQNL